MRKALFVAMLTVLALFAALGVGVFMQGAREHAHRPLIDAAPGVQARLDDAFPRAGWVHADALC